MTPEALDLLFQAHAAAQAQLDVIEKVLQSLSQKPIPQASGFTPNRLLDPALPSHDEMMGRDWLGQRLKSKSSVPWRTLPDAVKEIEVMLAVGALSSEQVNSLSDHLALCESRLRRLR